MAVKLGSVPPESLNGGALNETSPPDQRSSKLRSPIGPGPKRDTNGAYLPAAYKLPNGGTREDR